jgi:F0F1-type ATP synthase membrane subunit b/b'
MAEASITVLDQLDQLEEIMLEGTRIPFSGGRLVNEQDAIEVMDAVREALPGQISHAVDLIRQRDEFIAQARRQAEEIVAVAQREREQLINNASIRQEAERQVAELREQARQQCEQLLLQGRQQAAKAEQEHQARLAQMEQQFATRRQQLEQEAAERNRLLLEQHERNRQQAMAELEQIRQEGLRVQRESQAEAERLHNDALQFRQQTQQQCDQLVARTRHEAGAISEGANRYAEQVLGELEGRLKELGQVVLAGRHELVRLQVPEGQPTAEVPSAGPAGGAGSDAARQSRRRRVANSLRQLAG